MKKLRYREISNYKHHYHAVRHLFEELGKKGGFKLNLSFSSSKGHTSSFQTPDDNITPRFVTLIHRFLDSNDALYMHKIWRQISEEFESDILPEEAEQYTNLSESLHTHSSIKFVHNNKEMMPHELYELVARGEYFGEEDTAKKYLQSIASIPGVAEIHRWEFYNYSVHSMGLISFIFGVIRRLESTTAFKIRFCYPLAISNKCIFCLHEDGEFTEEEHIVPESLGNTELVLPRGYVCKKCNNEILSDLDQALIDTPLLSFAYVENVTYSKQGKFPEVKLGPLTIKRTGPRNMHIKEATGAKAIKMSDADENDIVNIGFKGKIPNKLRWRMLARAIAKIAYETDILDYGRYFMMGSDFNSIRAFILERDFDFKGHLLLKSNCTYSKKSSCNNFRLPKETISIISFWGQEFRINLQESEGYDLSEWKEAGYVPVPLFGDCTPDSFQFHMKQPEEVMLAWRDRITNLGNGH